MTQQLIELSFPLVAVPKGRPRFHGGNVFTPIKTRNFENTIKFMAMKQYRDAALSGPLKVTAVFYFVRPKSVTRRFPSAKPDIDNLTKSLLDSVESILFTNDSQIIDLHAYKRYANKSLITLRVESIK